MGGKSLHQLKVFTNLETLIESTKSLKYFFPYKHRVELLHRP